MPPKPRVVDFDDLPTLAGIRLTGPSHTVGAASKELFARATWIHEMAAEQAPELPADIIEGFHTLALLDALTAEVLRYDPVTAWGYNYGLNRVRFTAPLRVGDSFHLDVTVQRVTPRRGGYVVEYDSTVMPDEGSKPYLVADWRVLLLPRDGTGPAGARAD